MFTITVKKTFFASHYLKNYSDVNEPIHDHQWIIEAKFESSTLDKAGCAIDFRDIDRAFQEILTPYQGKNLNDLEAFKKTSPSAENIACVVFEQLSKFLKGKAAHLASVTAWEDESHGATYSL